MLCIYIVIDIYIYSYVYMYECVCFVCMLCLPIVAYYYSILFPLLMQTLQSAVHRQSVSQSLLSMSTRWRLQHSQKSIIIVSPRSILISCGLCDVLVSDVSDFYNKNLCTEGESERVVKGCEDEVEGSVKCDNEAEQA